jgi:hypothetical protein
MRVLLDGVEIPAPGSTLAEAIDAGRRCAERVGRLIVEVSLDGRILTGPALRDAETVPVDAASVHLVSAVPGELVSASMLEAADALAGAHADHQRIADRIHAGDAQDAMNALAQTLAAWQTASDVFSQGCGLLGWTPRQIDQTPPGDPALTDRLAALLTEVQRGLSDQDLVAVADTIGYKLGPLVTPWVGLLRSAADRAARTGHAG